IILSIGYGKDPATGRLLYNQFGPLTHQGGERRLNVAVTRAKERMTLVSTFTHHDMDPSRSSAKGIGLLRAYLEYCASKGSNFPKSLARSPRSIRSRPTFGTASRPREFRWSPSSAYPDTGSTSRRSIRPSQAA